MLQNQSNGKNTRRLPSATIKTKISLKILGTSFVLCAIFDAHVCVRIEKDKRCEVIKRDKKDS